MKYIIFILFMFFPLNSYATIKFEIKSKLENTNNIYFKFTQKIDNEIEKGECKISYPKKIYCKYDDIFEKILVSNGKSLVINSKKIKNDLRYNIKNTSLNLILDKDFLVKKLNEIDKIEEDNDMFFFKIKHEDSLVKIFFDKRNYDLRGWSTIDIYQNKVETILFNIETNIIIDQNIFRVQNYIN